MRRAALAAALLIALAANAAAETYPARPVRLIVPFPPGGPSDVLARVITQKLTENLKQQFYIENRGGAGGTIGADLVARSPADGYTLLYGSTTILAVSPTMYANLAYDPASAFQAIGLFASVPLSLVANRDLPVSTVPELIEYVKARPGKLFYGSAGNGTQVHFAAVLFKSRAGLEITHVPYKGGGPAMAAMLTGEFQYMFDTPQSSLPYVRDGRIKMLALTSLTRSPLLPEYPTIAETALPGFEVISWNGFVAPAGTPREIVTTLNRALRSLTSSKEFVGVLASLGASPTYSTAEDMDALIKRDLVTWKKVADENGIRPE